MKIFKNLFIAGTFVLSAALLSAAPAWAQTADTALVLGTVTDPGGAVVPDATAELTNAATASLLCLHGPRGCDRRNSLRGELERKCRFNSASCV